MKPLRIATLNCLNLALPGRRIYAGYEPYTADEYIAKTQWLAQMLDRLAADVVLVQEVFHEQALSDVVRQSAGGARHWSASAPLAGQDNDKPRVGLIWRQSLHPRVESIVDFPAGTAVAVPEIGLHTGFSRPLLRAEVAVPDFAGGTTLTLLNVHLKSRRPDFADGEDRDDPAVVARAELRSLIKRGVEAAALRRIAVEAMRAPRAPLVVAGDFNDEADAVTTQIVADRSCKPDEHIARDFVLFNALDIEQRQAPGRGRNVAFTAFNGGEPERIDHVLVSDAFLPQSKHAIGRVAAVEILCDHLLERRRDPAGGARLDRIYSDHAAVCVTLAPLAGGLAS